MPKFTEFEPQNEEFDLHDLLAAVSEIGFDEDTLAWLLPFLQHPECLPCPIPEYMHPEQTEMSDFVRERERQLRENCLAALKACRDRAHSTRDALVVDLIQSLVGLERYLFHNIFTFRDEQREFVTVRDSWRQRLTSLRVNWVQGIRDVSSKTRISFQLGIALLALEARSVFRWEEMLKLGKAVDPRLVDESRNLREEGQNTRISSELMDLIQDPEGLVYWMECFLRSGRTFEVDTLLGLLQSVDTSEHPLVLTQLVNAGSIFFHIQRARIHSILDRKSVV